MENKKLTPIAAALGAAVTGTLLTVGSVQAAENPFGLSELNGGYLQVAASHEGKCGEGKCGGDKAKSEGKCGEGKCGGDKAKSEGKCGEGKCGGDKKASSSEGKCGEGKCGGKK